MTPNDPPFIAPAEPSSARTTRPASGGGGGDNVVDLVRQLAGQGSHLAERQLDLIKAEIRESASEMKTALGAIVGAAVVGMAGLGVLLMGVAFLLGQAIDNVAIATLIVGAATLVLAYILYSSASKKMRSAHLAPERTQHTLERTPDMVRGDLHTEHTR